MSQAKIHLFPIKIELNSEEERNKNSLLSLPSAHSSSLCISLLPVWALQCLQLLSGDAACFSMGRGGISVWCLAVPSTVPPTSLLISFLKHVFPEPALLLEPVVCGTRQPGLASQSPAAVPLPELSTSTLCATCSAEVSSGIPSSNAEGCYLQSHSHH